MDIAPINYTANSLQILEQCNNNYATVQQVNSVIPDITINNIIHNKSILSYQTKQIVNKQQLIEYIRHKISLIDQLKINLIVEGTYGSLLKEVSLSGNDILADHINLTENCAVISSAIFDCLTNLESPTFLGEDFQVKLVAIDKSETLKTFRDSKIPTEQRKIDSVLHCYLIVEHSNFDDKIIVDPTVSNYRSDQNTFIGTTTDLLQSLLGLLTEKKCYYKNKLPLCHKNMQIILDINNFLYLGKGNARSMAVAIKNAWYG